MDADVASLLVRMGGSGLIGWQRLLESKRVLIVAEAGSGKSHECRTQQQELWDAGEPAFYLDLSQLANTSIDQLLSADEEERLNKWMAAQYEVATFFLDSIDELKLSLGSFKVALRRLAKAIAGHLGRARIVITTRPIAIDQQLLEQNLPLPPPPTEVVGGEAFADAAMGLQRKTSEGGENDAAPQWRRVGLTPLSEDQIRQMAVIQGVANPDDLLADIRARNAQDFARRPQDLIELCSDWLSHNRIRTHFEQVEGNIRVKLKARTDRPERAPLSEEKALEGASRLALATLLTRRLTIRHSAEADRGGEPGTALDPSIILSDWTVDERATLLERALFGFATYGRVRFHHRSVVEFLAARRIAKRLASGMPKGMVKRILFAEAPHGLKVVRPMLRPVAAWLAASEVSVFAEVRDREPEILLNYGDPEVLSPVQRRDALRTFVGRYGAGGFRGITVPELQVQRLASSDLEPDVQELWGPSIGNREVRELLLDLIGVGGMTKCADIAHSVAVDGAASAGERVSAIASLVSLKDSRVTAIVQSIVDNPVQWPHIVVRGALNTIFPAHISPVTLCEILSRVQKSEGAIEVLSYSFPSIIAEYKFEASYLSALRDGLTRVLVDGLVWKKDRLHPSTKKSRLVPVLASTCLRMLREGITEPEVIRSSVIALRLHRESHVHDEVSKELRSALAGSPRSIRQAAFWAYDSFNESFHHQTDPWQRLFAAQRYGPIQLEEGPDGDWIRTILRDRGRNYSERMMMLIVALRYIWNGIDDRENYLRQLRQLVSDDAALVGAIDEFETPRPVDPEAAKFHERQRKQREADDKRAEQDRAEWIAFWAEIAQNPDVALGPERIEKTAWKLWVVMRSAGRENGMSGWNRRFIEQHFGSSIAERIRQNMRILWRGERPTLRNERSTKERNTTQYRWHFGLAALSAEAEDANWAARLSPDEAEVAARYAAIEINGFPAWIDPLARFHSVALEKTLGPDLSAELEEIAASQGFDPLLQALSHSTATVVRLFTPRLRAWLERSGGNLQAGEDEAAAHVRLERVLEILLTHGDDEIRRSVKCIVLERLKGPSAAPFTLPLLATLLRIDPVVSVAALEDHLAPITPSADGPAIDVFGGLFGDRHSRLRVNLKVSEFPPALLYRLLRLSYQYVRIGDDAKHPDGVYTPNRRDDAEEGRNVLLSAVLNATGQEAWGVKVQMQADPLFAHFKDRLAILARERAAEELEGQPWPEAEVVKLERYGEASPITRDDMFAVLNDRLDDIEDLLLQDVSPRAAWMCIKEERVMRQQIALQLHSAANGVYSVDQEAVTADEKETDIRLRVAGSGQQAAIELKIAEKGWSGKVLRDTIESQLVKKYMAAEQCRSGCLAVTVGSNRTWVHPDTAEVLDISGLRIMLNAEAARVTEDLGGCVRIAVRVLDLRPRLKTERA